MSLARFFTRWSWRQLRRWGVTLDDVDVDAINATRRAERDAADAAVEGIERFTHCLVNGLRIAGPSEEQ